MSWMKRGLRWCTTLMRQLNFGAKIGLLVASLLLPLMALIAWQADLAWKELRQSERLLGSARWLDLAADLPPQREAGAEVLARLDAGLPADLPELRGAWQAAKTAWQTEPGGVAAERAMHQFSLQLAERSGLMFDATPAVVLRLALDLHRLDHLEDRLHEAADLGPAGKTSLRAEMAFLDETLDMLHRAGVQPSNAWQELRGQLQSQDDGLLNGGAVHRLQFQAVISGLHHELRTGLVHTLEARHEALRQRLWLGGAFALALLIGTALLAWAILHSLKSTVRLITGQLERLADGDLSAATQVRGRDELAHIGVLLERTAQRMSAMVAEIRTSAVRVGQAGEAVAGEGVALARRTESQATTLDDSVRAVERLSRDVGATAEAVIKLGQLSERLCHQAQEGRTLMRSAVDGTAELQESARRVGEINGVVDDLAFQTNLVALNASVEAARAGDSGRGFSVVAAEIRQLALRCAEAAGEVRGLIERTGDQVETSASRIAEVSEVLDNVSGGVDHMVRRLAEIGESGRLQGQSLHQVSEDVRALQALTRENAATVVSTEAASRAMVAQSAALRASVAAVALRQGTADEARALVERARHRVAEVGWARAAEDFHRPDGGFIDRDLYIFAFDAQGQYLACGAEPARTGRLLSDMPGLTHQIVDQVVREGSRVAAEGGGWIEYDFVLSYDGIAHRKSAWVVPLGDGAFMGCGVNHNPVRAGDSPATGGRVLQPA